MENNILQLSNKNPKVPLYVSAYEKLYEKVINGDFKAGDKLPSENQLAELLDISRGTLRQALLLLQEDGLIANRQGVGNFITINNKKLDNNSNGLEKISIIPLTYSEVDCEVVLSDVLYQPASKRIQENLQMDKAKLIALFEIIFVAEDEVIGTMDVFIPYDTLNESNISLNQHEALKDFILNYIDTHASNSHLSIRVVEGREKVTERLKVNEGTPVICFYEIMYSESGVPSVYSKSYCIPTYFDFYINRKK